ncbi:ATP-binding protein [Chitinophagaceae bacterium MMS25-I14]
MFRRYPYWGILATAFLLWVAAAGLFSRNRQQAQPAKLAAAVNKDLRQRLLAYSRLRADSQLLMRICNRQIKEKDLELLTAQPFFFYVYRNNKLVFWNSNEALADCSALQHTGDSLKAGKSISYGFCDSFTFEKRRYDLAVAINLAWVYPFKNNYLQSHWSASPLIPATTAIYYKPVAGTYPVYDLHHQPVMYLRFHPEDIQDVLPDITIICLILAAALFTILWLQLIALYIARSRSAGAAIFFTAFIVVTLRVISYKTGLPFHINETEFFSPQLYSYSLVWPSFGDVLINAICFSWIFTFVLSQKHRWPGSGNIGRPAALRIILMLALVTLIGFYSVYFIKLVRSLVLDSHISFDLAHYNTVNGYTVVGIITIALIVSISALFIYFINQRINGIFSNRIIKYLLFWGISTACFYTLKEEQDYSHFFNYLVPLWLTLFLVLLDVERLRVSMELFSIRMIVWAVFLCLSGALLLQYFSYEKEKENRKIFASKLLQQDDPAMQSLFPSVVSDIQDDEMLHAFMKKPSVQARSILNDRIDVLYLNRYLNRYQAELYLYDTSGRNLYNADTADIHTADLKIASANTDADSVLFFRKEVKDGHNYMARIRIYDQSDGRLEGFLFIDFSQRKENKEAVYPELLQPGNNSQVTAGRDYDYAVYEQGQLTYQTNNYPFGITEPKDVPDKEEYNFTTSDGYSFLWYKADDKTAVIVYRPDLVWTFLRLFSFLFGAQLISSIFFLLYRSMARYLSFTHIRIKISRAPLSTRIRYSVLGVVLISFIVIGFATSLVLSNQYKKSTDNKLRATMQLLESNILQHLQQHSGEADTGAYNKETQQAEFRYFITSLANQQYVDINVFNVHGALNASSQPHIYDKNLLAKQMRPEAYYHLKYGQLSSLTQQESIGQLYYLSCYMPLRNASGTTLGYINMPYFSSEKQLNEQISSVVSALLNLYAFMFLLSGLVAVLFTRNLTKSLNMIITGFNQINLAQNKPLEWPYEDDEIGKLVQAYNRMVKTVEEQAARLVQNEREGAWREMARQVAHEIKNPLTPMKLNIQYLQRAIQSDQPNVPELAARVAGSLVEQIDNLSYIASEFSNFAKLPEVKPEIIRLNELLRKTVALYLNKENVTVGFIDWPDPLDVLIDRSQLLRVCTNLLQNAIQAIPEDREGVVTVVLRRKDDMALLSFSDNGKGISSEVSEKIFEPYFTTKSSGTGLGLAMTRKMVELSGGRIWFETLEGEGTTFFILLPLEEKR